MRRHGSMMNTMLFGPAKKRSKNVFDAAQTTVKAGVWTRDFEQGKVIVNASSSQQMVTLQGEYENCAARKTGRSTTARSSHVCR